MVIRVSVRAARGALVHRGSQLLRRCLPKLIFHVDAGGSSDRHFGTRRDPFISSFNELSAASSNWSGNVCGWFPVTAFIG